MTSKAPAIVALPRSFSALEMVTRIGPPSPLIAHPCRCAREKCLQDVVDADRESQPDVRTAEYATPLFRRPLGRERILIAGEGILDFRMSGHQDCRRCSVISRVVGGARRGNSRVQPPRSQETIDPQQSAFRFAQTVEPDPYLGCN